MAFFQPGSAGLGAHSFFFFYGGLENGFCLKIVIIQLRLSFPGRLQSEFCWRIHVCLYFVSSWGSMPTSSWAHDTLWQVTWWYSRFTSPFIRQATLQSYSGSLELGRSGGVGGGKGGWLGRFGQNSEVKKKMSHSNTLTWPKIPFLRTSSLKIFIVNNSDFDTFVRLIIVSRCLRWDYPFYGVRSFFSLQN